MQQAYKMKDKERYPIFIGETTLVHLWKTE